MAHDHVLFYSLLGVGGADDCVQVVSVEETISAKAQSSCSLLKYCKSAERWYV